MKAARSIVAPIVVLAACGTIVLAHADTGNGPSGIDAVRQLAEEMADAASKRFSEVLKGERVAQAQGSRSPAPGAPPAADEDPWTAALRWYEHSGREYQSIMRRLAQSGGPQAPGSQPASQPPPQAQPPSPRSQPAPSAPAAQPPPPPPAAQVVAGEGESGTDWLTRSSERFQSLMRRLAEGAAPPQPSRVAQPVAPAVQPSQPPAVAIAKPPESSKGDDERRLAEARRAREAEVTRTEDALKAEQARRMGEARPDDPRKADETRRAADAKRAEDVRRVGEVARAEQARKVAEAKLAEEARAAEVARKAAEAKRVGEAKRAEVAAKADAEKEERRRAEERRQQKASEERRMAEQKAADDRRLAEQKEQTRRDADKEERRRTEERRLADQQTKAEARRVAEARTPPPRTAERAPEAAGGRTEGARVAAARIEAGAARRGRRAPSRGCEAGRERVKVPGWYVVKSGDTLWAIAARHYGAGWRYERIYAANRRRIDSADEIRPCQRVYLPRKTRRA